MTDMNVNVLVGNLTRDPELRYTNNQQAVCNFSIANNYTYMQNNQKVEIVSYFDIVAWGKLGEICNEHLKKGKKACIEGRLSQRRWKTQEGDGRTKIEIVAKNVQFLSFGDKQNQNNNQTQPENNRENVQYAKKVFQEGTQENNSGEDYGDDDIPF